MKKLLLLLLALLALGPALAIAGDYGYTQPYLNIIAPNQIDGVSVTNSTFSVPTARKGTFVCTSGGSITVANANMLVTSNVIISLNTAGGTVSTPPAMKSVATGTNFIALCATSDTSTYNYAILN